MTFDADTTYTQLHPYFQGRIRHNEPLARHGTFGVGGPVDIWVSLEKPKELLDLVRLCMQDHCPLARQQPQRGGRGTHKQKP